MIDELRISNLGVIDQAVLPLGPGFTALTGETGAGKTMVITALNLLLGGRADSSTVRTGSNSAIIDGILELQPQHPARIKAGELGADPNEDLIISRLVSSDGKSKAFLAGRPVPAGTLAELSEQLVTVHGQSDQLRLKNTAQQRDTLDKFAGPEFAKLFAEYSKLYRQYLVSQKELAELTALQSARISEAELLREALIDFERIQPKAGEEVELDAQIERLANLENLRLAAGSAYEQLRSSELDQLDAIAQVTTARKELERVAAVDDRLNATAVELAELEFRLTDVLLALSDYLSGLDSDSEQSLELLQQRKGELTQLIRKYGGTLDEAIAYWQTASDRLLELDQTGDRIADLTAQLDALAQKLETCADQITAGRHAAAAELSKLVTAELSALAMPEAKITVQVQASEKLTSTGGDDIEFLLQAHPGAPARSISKAASGGELSRIMLAFEVVLASVDHLPSYIFDEVDAGIGGAAAIEVGKRLARLAKHAQVVVVTHLAQVAAFATNHLKVTKTVSENLTSSSVIALSGPERRAEIARLLSGLETSETGLAHADELLQIAKGF